MINSNDITTNPYQIQFNFDELVMLKDFFKMTKEWLSENNMNLPSVIKIYINMFEQYEATNGLKSNASFLFKKMLNDEFVKAMNKPNNIYSPSDMLNYTTIGNISTNNVALANWINTIENIYSTQIRKK